MIYSMRKLFFCKKMLLNVQFAPLRKDNGIVKSNLCQIIMEDNIKMCNFVSSVSLHKKKNYEIKAFIIVSNNFNVQHINWADSKTG